MIAVVKGKDFNSYWHIARDTRGVPYDGVLGACEMGVGCEILGCGALFIWMVKLVGVLWDSEWFVLVELWGAYEVLGSLHCIIGSDWLEVMNFVMLCWAL